VRGKYHPARPSSRLDNTEMNIKEFEGLDWIRTASVTGSCEHAKEP
jgi:hypothetical protein